MKSRYRTICFIGPHASGKSGVIGRILITVGLYPMRTREKFKVEATQLGFEPDRGFSFFTDRTSIERVKGTIHPSVSTDVKFAGNTYGLTSPSGNMRYFKTFTRTVALADVIGVVVSASDTNIESMIDCVRSQLWVADTLSSACTAFIVISKLDMIGDEAKYEVFCKIRDAVVPVVSEFFKVLGVIPTDTEGHNLASYYQYPNFPATVADTFVGLFKEPPEMKYANDDLLGGSGVKDTFFCTFARYLIKGIGSVVTGRMVLGTIRPGGKYWVNGVMVDGKKQCPVFSVEQFYHSLPEASSGFVGLNLKGIRATELFRGCIISNIPMDSIKWAVAEITAHIPFSIRVGTTFTLSTHFTNVPCTISKITPNKQDNYQKGILKKGATAVVSFTLDKPVVMMTYMKVPWLGSFIFSFCKTPCAAGKVSILDKSQDVSALIEYWPSLHFLLMGVCKDTIEELLCCLSVTRNDVYYELKVIIAKFTIALWFKEYTNR